MIFITLSKLRKKATKEMANEVSKIMQAMTEKGVKIIGFYWTLGRYDTVVIWRHPTRKQL